MIIKTSIMGIWIGLLLIFSITVRGQDVDVDCSDGLGFKYLILYESVDRDSGDPKARQLVIFLDERAYSKENLRKLFIYISNRYPAPENMFVSLETSWDRVRASNDFCPGSAISGSRPYLYYSATYHRDESGERFYYVPKIGATNQEKVWIKRRSPVPPCFPHCRN